MKKCFVKYLLTADRYNVQSMICLNKQTDESEEY